MKSAKNFLSIITIILCSILLFLSKSTPVTKIWKSFQVLYVENSVPEEAVLSALEKFGCRDVITFSQQQQPFYSIYTPVELKSSNTDYLAERLKYFTDLNNQFRLYYIPQEFNSNAEKALTFMKKNNSIKAGLDGKANYLWLLPLLCFIFYMAFGVASKNRALFFGTSLMPLVYVLVKPYFASCVAVIMFMMAVFFSEKYFNRKKTARVLSRSFYIITPVLNAITVLFIFSWKDALVFLAVLAAVFSFYVLISSYQKYLDSKAPFNFTYIVPANLIPVMNRDTSKYILLTAGGLVVMIFLFLVQGRFSGGATYSGLILPSPVEKTVELPEELSSAEKLPGLEDYYEWIWNTVTFPYKNINRRGQSEKLAKGDQIVIEKYTNTKVGIITEKQVVYEYNDDFTAKIDESIEKLNYPAIEKLMKEQGEIFGAKYAASSNGSQEDNTVSFVLIILCLLVTIFMYFYYYVTGRKS